MNMFLNELFTIHTCGLHFDNALSDKEYLT